MVFAPPSPPFYFFKDGDMYRIPLEIYDGGEEFKNEQFEKMDSKTTEMSIMKITTARSKEIAAVFIKHKAATATILFSHGNAADIGIMSYHFELMAENLKVNVFGYDYTGYGESSDLGKPSPADVFEDAEAAYRYVTTDLKIATEQIIFYGQSLGSGPSIYLAKKYPVLGVVIHSGLMSAVRVINPHVTRTPWYDIFPNVDNIKHAKSPVWVIHGEADEIIPVYHGIRLYKAAPVTIKPWFVPGGDHNDIELEFQSEYFLRLNWALEDFTRGYGKRPADAKDDKNKKISVVTTQPGADKQNRELLSSPPRTNTATSASHQPGTSLGSPSAKHNLGSERGSSVELQVAQVGGHQRGLSETEGRRLVDSKVADHHQPVHKDDPKELGNVSRVGESAALV